MAGVILISAADLPYTSSCLMPDNGLASLAACLAAEGHRVRIWDPGTVDTLQQIFTPQQRQQARQLWQQRGSGMPPAGQLAQLTQLCAASDAALERIYQQATEELDRWVRRLDARLLGIKLWFGAGAMAAMGLARRLVRLHPRLRVFAGGPAASLAPRALLEAFPLLGGACVGDGEQTIVALAEHCAGKRPLASVPNLVLRDGARPARTEQRRVALDDLPHPLYEPQVYPAMAAQQKLPLFHLDESRGCPMGCSFCVHPTLTGATERALRATRVVRRMDQLHQQFGVRHFRLSGSWAPGRRLGQLAAALERRRYHYAGFAHLGALAPRDLPRLARSGLVGLFFGLESGAQQLLDGSLGKRLRPADAPRVLGACMEAGVFASGSVIFPAPGETAQTEARTEALLVQLFADQALGAAVIQPAFPSPGSAWGQHPEGHGFGLDRRQLLSALLSRRAPTALQPALLAEQEAPAYTLHGEPFSQLARRAATLRQRLQRQGVTTGVNDELVITAHAVGLDPVALYQLDAEIFATADHERADELLARAWNSSPSP